MPARILPFEGNEDRSDRHDSGRILYGGVHDIDATLEEAPDQASQLLIWVQGDGQVLGQAIVPTDDPLEIGEMPQLSLGLPAGGAAESLELALGRFFTQQGHPPARIVVNSDRLEALAASVCPHVPREVGPTPPTVEVMEFLTEQMDPEGPFSWIGGLCDPAGIEELMGAAGKFLGCRPWEQIPPSDWLIGMTVPGEESLEHLVFVMGGGGEEFGVLVFPNLTEWRLHVHQASSGTLPPAGARVAPFLSLSFTPRDELNELDRQVLETKGWTTGFDLEPEVFARRDDGSLTPPDDDDIYELLAVLTAINGIVGVYREEGLSPDTASPLYYELAIENDSGDTEEFEFHIPPRSLVGATDGGVREDGPTIDVLARQFLHQRSDEVKPATFERDRRTMAEFVVEMNEIIPDGTLPEGTSASDIHGPELFVRFMIEGVLGWEPDAFASKTHYEDTRRVSRHFLRFLTREGWLDELVGESLRQRLSPSG